VGGTLVDSDKAAYVPGFDGSRPSQSAALAGSILRYVMVVMVVGVVLTVVVVLVVVVMVVVVKVVKGNES
jgi:hypothetical protein